MEMCQVVHKVGYITFFWTEKNFIGVFRYEGTKKCRYIWGRNGFDGDIEVSEAGSGGCRLKQPKNVLNANKNLAYAA